MIDSTNPRVLADNVRHLAGASGSQASDISTLQNAVEALGTYSTDEVDTGKKWVDGNNIYRKIITIESLPNNTYQSYAHNISNIDTIVRFYGVTKITNDNAARMLGYSGSGTNGFIVSLSNISITTNSDMSGFSAYVGIEYTKSASPAALTSPAPDDTRSIEPEVREEEPIIDEPIEEPVVEVKKTTRKKTTTIE